MTVTDTAPARQSLGPTSGNRRWFVEVADPDAPSFDPAAISDDDWVPLRGIMELKVDPGTGETNEVSDFDGEGFKNFEVNALGWGITGKIRRAKVLGTGTDTVPAIYDEGQEILRRQKGQLQHSVPVRVCEIAGRNMPRIEAYQGFVAVVWAEDGGDMKASGTVALTLTGQGRPEEIEHPYPVNRTA